MMRYFKRWRQCLAGLLCVSMTAVNLSGSSVTAFAKPAGEIASETEAAPEEQGPDVQVSTEVQNPDTQETPQTEAQEPEDLTPAEAEAQEPEDLTPVETEADAPEEVQNADTRVSDGGNTQTPSGSQAQPEQQDKPGKQARALAEDVTEEEITALTQDEAVDVRISEQGGAKWFSFTPEVSGRYRFASAGDYDTLAYLYTDPQGEALEENDDISTSDANFALEYALEAGVTYYYSAQMCYDYVTGFFEVSVSYVSKSVAEAVVANPMRTKYYSLFDTSVSAQGLELEVVYTDGTEETVRSGYTSGTGNSIALTHSVKSSYDSSVGHNVLTQGTYGASLSYIDWEMPVEITVADIGEAPMLGENLTVEGTGTYREDYYRMKAPSTGYFMSTVFSEQQYNLNSYSMFYSLDGTQLETKYNSSNNLRSGRAVYLEKDAVYVVKTYHSNNLYEGSYFLSIKAAGAIEAAGPGTGREIGFYSFVPEEDGVYRFQIDTAWSGSSSYELTMYRSDWTNTPVQWTGSNLYMDEEGNRRYHLNYESVLLTAGEAYYVIYQPYYSDTWQISVRNASAAELIMEKPVNGTFTEERLSYQFTAPEDGTYHFKTVSSRSVGYGIYDANDSSEVTLASNTHWLEGTGYCEVVAELAAGKDYLVHFANSGSAGVDFELSVNLLPELESIAVSKLPDQTEFVRTGLPVYDGLEVTAAYADGSKEVIGYGSYGNMTGQRISLNSGNLTDQIGRLRVGTQNIGVFYLGKQTEYSVTVRGETAEEIAAACQELTLDQEVTETVPEYTNKRLQYRFTAPESGFYRLSNTFSSMNVYDSAWNQLEYYSVTESGLYVRCCYLEKGQTYVCESRQNYYYEETVCRVKIEEAGFDVLGDDDTLAGTTEQENQNIYLGYIPKETGTHSFTLRLSANSNAEFYLYGRDGQSGCNVTSESSGSYYDRQVAVDLEAGQAYLFRICIRTSGTAYTFGMSKTVIPSGITALEDGKEYPVTIDAEGGAKWFSYTPEETASYCAYSSDNNGDTYVTLYREGTGNVNRITEDDDDGEGNNFHLDYRLEKGVTYYYKAHMYSGRTGSYTFHFKKAVPVSKMEITKYPQQIYYALPNESFRADGLVVKVTYQDGSDEEVTYGSSSLNGHSLSVDNPIPGDSDGNWIPGEYVAEVVYFGETITYPVTVTEASEMAAVLTEGTPATGNQGGEDRQLWSFTPSADGKYLFRSIQKTTAMGLRLYQGRQQLSAEISNYRTNSSYYDETTEQNVYAYTREQVYSLEAGVTYYLRGYPESSSEPAGEACTYSVEAERLPGYSTGSVLDGTADASRGRYAEITVQEEGYYHFESVTENSSSYYNAMELSFWEGNRRLSTNSGSYSVSVMTDSGRLYRYYYQYYVYLKPGTYVMQGYSSDSGNRYTISGERVTSWDIQNVIEDTMNANSYTYRGYEITAPSDGAYTFTNRITGYDSGSLYLYDQNGSRIGTSTSESSYENGVNYYTRTAGADLTAGEKYLLLVYSSMTGSSERDYTLVGQFSPKVTSVEFIQYPQQIYYYKVDRLTADSTLSTGSVVQLTYEDGKTETISYNGTSKYTGRRYTIEMPENASYNSSGYLKIGQYKAVFRYLDYTQEVPVQVRSLSAMPAVSLDENGQGSYSGDTENACGYGYVRFTGVSDGFYNLTLSVDRGSYISYERIVNSAYSSMNTYSTTASVTDTRYLRNASVYVRQGQSCYMKYLKSSNNSITGGTGGEFTLSVEKATDRDIAELTCNEAAEVNITSTAVDQWYSFTPEETGTYLLNTQGAPYYTYMNLYASPDASGTLGAGTNSRNGNDRYLQCSLTAGRTYYFRVYNGNRTGSFQLMLVKQASRAVSLELLTEGEIFCSSLPDYIANSFSDLEFLATYEDGTTEKLTFGYNGTSERYVSLQGQRMNYTEPQWEYDENHEYILDKDYKVTFSYMNVSLEINVTARSIQDLTTADGTVTASIPAGKYEYYKFVPANTGYYRFDASSASVYPEPGMFDPYMKAIDSRYSNSYPADGMYHQIKVYRLTAGESYCLRLGNMSQSAAQISCSNARLSPAESIEVSTYPQRRYYLGVDNQYTTDGLSVLVTYEDGTTERVSAGSHSDRTGLALATQLSGNEEGNPYFGTEGSKTIRITYMDVSTSYTVQVLKNEEVPEMTAEKPYTGTISDAKDSVYAKVVAEESGYYQFMLSCGGELVPYIRSVKNSSYTDMPSWNGAYYNDTLVSGDGTNTRMKLVYLLAGRTYFMKGSLTRDGAQAAGDYTVSIERISDLADGVQTGTLGRYGADVFQYTAERDGYYQFTLDAGENAGFGLFNSSFHPVSISEGSRNNRRYYVAKLRAGTVYMASCTNSGSTPLDYSLHAAPKAEVAEIRIAKQPEKTLYYSWFETSVHTQGLAIEIVYADNTTELLEYGKRSSWGVEMKLDYSAVTRDEKGRFLAGKQTIGCEYLDQKATFEIEVQNFDISMAEEIEPERMQTLNIPAGESAFYIFTPAASGNYRFYSRGTAAAFGYIYDSAGNMLYSNAAAAPKTDFTITAGLTAGNRYILRVRAFSSQEAISTSVRLHDMAAFTEVTGVNVAPSEVVFGRIGETRKLQASVLPEDAQNPAVTFYSSNEAVATVSADGLLTAVAEGSATVTVTTSDGGYTADCSVIVDTTKPEITHVSPLDGSIIGPAARTMWVYTHDNIGIAMLEVEYKKSADAAYTKHTLMEDGRTDAVILADIPLDGFADQDRVDVRLVAVDKGGNRSDAVTRTYTVDKNAPEIEGLAGVHNKETLAVDLTWKGKMEQDISGYSIYRKNRNAADSTYVYLGFVTGYVNKEDYQFSDTSVPNQNASYTYRLTANDKFGNSREYTVPVDVERVNQAPQIQLSCAGTMVSGREYVFDLSASTDDGRITSFEINYGDGTEVQTGTTETAFTHTYTLPDGVKEKEVTVIITATDNEGLTATETKVIRIVNLSDVGMLTVQVTDTDGIPLANAPVYFNMGEDAQVITHTNRSGKAEFTDVPGMYAVGVYVSGYLPVKKNVELAVGETKTLTFTMEEKELVEGKFESHRMTLDEVREAADKGIIDLETDPTNYHVIRYEVTLEYTTMNFYYNEGGGLIGFGGGAPGYTYIPSFVSEEIVVILKIPVKVSMLKEFYAVDLIIINNADEEFSLLENHVSLNVPEGLTVMDGGGANGAEVDIAEIKGQTTETVSWILRGDQSGEYYLSADFTGVLSEFDVPVTSSFTSEEPVRVYGVDNLGVSMKIPDRFTNGEFYYSLTMENTAEKGENAADMYLPGIDGAGELIQTMLMKEDGTKEYISEMPEVLHAGERIERFYRITDQIYEQLQQYPNYQDFVFYFRRMWVEELTSYGVPLNVEVVPAEQLAAVYEQYRAEPATVKSVSAQGAAYGYSRGEVKLLAEAEAAANAEYDLIYEWYDTNYDKIGTGAELALEEGLAAGDYHYHCLVVSTRKDNGNKAQTQYQDVVLTITGRTAELVWSGDQNLVYNGTPAGVTAVLNNVLAGDTCTVTVTGGNGTNAGTYTAKAAALSNANYSLPQETEHTYTIAPKTVGLTWSGAGNRTYDGTASQVTAAADGLVTGDACAVTVTDGDRIHAGTYTALATGLDNGNYALPETVSQNYTIEKAPLAAAYTGETIYYGTTPALAVGVTGFVGGETAETALQYTAPAIADTVPATEGTHSLTPSGGAAADYTFAYTAGSLIIVRRDAAEGADGQYTVTAPQGSNGWYTADLEIRPNAGYAIGDSEDSIAGTGITLHEDTASGTRGFYIKNTQTGEIFNQSSLSYQKDAAAPVIGSFAAAPDNAGRQTVTFTVSDALSGIDPESIAVTTNGTSIDVTAENGSCRFLTAGAGTYTVSVKDLAGNTTAKELAVSALRFDSRGGSACEAMDLVQGAAYGTLPQTTRAGYEFAGWKDADGNAASAETVAGNGDAVLTAEWTMIPAKAPSVAAEETEVQTVYGTAASLKVTAVPDADAQYALNFQWYLAENGTETAVEAGTAAELIIPASQAAGTYTYRCRVTAMREDNQDTAAVDSGDITVTIAPKKVSVAFANTETREYDGTASGVTAGINGLVNGDTCEVKVTGGNRKNAGSHTAEAAIAFAEGKEGCYQIEGSMSVTYTITPKAAELVWSGLKERTYDGKESNVTAVMEGLAEGDTCNVTVSGGTEKNAGTHKAEAAFTFAGGAENNYTVSGERTAEYTITPKAAEIVWSGVENRTYDGKESQVTATVSGMLEGDTCNVTVSGGAEKNAGTHKAEAALTFAGGAENNYTVSGSRTAEYTITPKAAELVWSGLEGRTYDGKASGVTAVVEGLAEGDTCNVTVTGGTEKNAGTHKAEAALAFTGGTERNYVVSGERTASYTITPKAAGLIWNGVESRVYDGQPSHVTASVNGLAEGDTCDITVTGGNAVNAGTYTATAASVNPNYQITGNMSVSYTIGKAAQTITPGAQEYTGTAGTKVSVSAVSTGGGALGYTCSDSSSGTVSADGTVSIGKPGKMVVTITAAATENYEAASCSVTVLALPKAVSVKKLTSPKAKRLKVTWKKDTSVSGYQIQYSLTAKFKKSQKKTWTTNVSGKKADKTIQKLKAGRKYYVRIRAYKTIDGKNYYGAYGKAKQIKVKK